MRWTILRAACLGAALLAPGGFTVSPTGSAEASSNHVSQRQIRLSFRDGMTRTGTLEGTGCMQTICSRIAIKGKDAHLVVTEVLDSLTAIKDISTNGATFVSKNGTERRLVLVQDFRVLYLKMPSGGTERVDLRSVRTVEFLPAQS